MAGTGLDHKLRALFAFTIALIIAGCVGYDFQAAGDMVQIIKISNRKGLYAEPVWFQNYLVVVYETGENVNAYSDRLWQIEPNGANMKPVLLPNHPGCALNAFTRPTRLSDGRLGYASICGDEKTLQRSYYLMAYESQTQKFASLREDSLPYAGIGPGGYAWAPNLAYGVAAHGWMISSGLYWYSPAEWRPLVTGLQQTSYGRWSHNGETIAFIGEQKQTAGTRVQTDHPKKLFVMPVTGGQSTSITEEFVNPLGLDWSPDGKWFILSADFGQGQGLWLINANTGANQMVIGGCYSEPSWSADSQKVAVTSCPNFGGMATSELYIIYMDALVRNSK